MCGGARMWFSGGGGGGMGLPLYLCMCVFFFFTPVLNWIAITLRALLLPHSSWFTVFSKSLCVLFCNESCHTPWIVSVTCSCRLHPYKKCLQWFKKFPKHPKCDQVGLTHTLAAIDFILLINLSVSEARVCVCLWFFFGSTSASFHITFPLTVVSH